MGNKEKLTELVSVLTEMQAGPLLAMSHNYLQAVRDAETKGRLEISNEVIKYITEAAPQLGGYDARPPAQPPMRPAIVPPGGQVQRG